MTSISILQWKLLYLREKFEWYCGKINIDNSTLKWYQFIKGKKDNVNLHCVPIFLIYVTLVLLRHNFRNLSLSAFEYTFNINDMYNHNHHFYKPWTPHHWGQISSTYFGVNSLRTFFAFLQWPHRGCSINTLVKQKVIVIFEIILSVYD